jgi:hypothetical protein
MCRILAFLPYYGFHARARTVQMQRRDSSDTSDTDPVTWPVAKVDPLVPIQESRDPYAVWR